MSLTSAEASFLAEHPYDNAGYDAAGVGDVNGDGLDDILIGAPLGDSAGPGTDSGQAYLVLGRSSGWRLNASLASADVFFTAQARLDQVGDAIAGVGDVNGDGLDDFLIGAPRNAEGAGTPGFGDGAGQTYLILGHAGPWPRRVNVAQTDASFLGETTGMLSGLSLAAGGDVNGDGFADFLIGAPRANTSAQAAGQAFLLLGHRGRWARDTPLSAAAAIFSGEDRSNEAASAMAGVGDVNGDGRDDLLIGAHFNDEAGHHAGKVYLMLSQGP
jgi:hypothetical protein